MKTNPQELHEVIKRQAEPAPKPPDAPTDDDYERPVLTADVESE